MATAPSSAPSFTPVPRGFGALCCPKCNEVGKVSIDLDDLTGDDACQCRECEETFPLSLVRDVITTWAKVVDWIDTAPPVQQ